MDFRYFPPASQQPYAYFAVGHPQQPQPDPQEQFQGVIPSTEPFAPPSYQQQFEPYPFSPQNSAELDGAQNPDVKPFPQAQILDNGDELQVEGAQARSSSEEKDNLTPAQSRRKAQNRAAQRAFRERKERRVRDLEQELNEYKQNFSTLLEDNETLKRQIAKVATENEILRATSNASHSPHEREPTTTGPMRYKPQDYSTATGEKKLPVHRIKVNDATGERLLDPSATWDLIVSHLSDQGLKLDVQDIYDRLKGHAQCDGQGPAIPESLVLKAIQDSLAAGNDELI